MKLVACPECRKQNKLLVGGYVGHHQWHCMLCERMGVSIVNEAGVSRRHSPIARVPEEVQAAYRLGGLDAAQALLLSLKS